MVQNEKTPFNIFVPNLINICIDASQNEEISGRLYHCYSEGPVPFLDIVGLIREAEKMFDAISFPQASTKTRCFTEKTNIAVSKPEKIRSQKEILEYTGEIGTFALSVRFRQNSTWQGEFQCIETGKVERFVNIVDLMKKMEEMLKRK